MDALLGRPMDAVVLSEKVLKVKQKVLLCQGLTITYLETSVKTEFIYSNSDKEDVFSLYNGECV